MAYVEGFKYDLFLSYARVDNLKAPSERRGWVEQLHAYLETRLAQRVGKIGAVRIWRDTRQVDGNHLFDTTIKKALEESAIFVALTSMGYLKSKYCQQELLEFHRKASNEVHGVAVNDRSRILNVLLYNIPHEEWPQLYGRTSGIPFYFTREPGQIGKPHNPGDTRFQGSVYALTETIYALLNGINAAQSRPLSGRVDGAAESPPRSDGLSTKPLEETPTTGPTPARRPTYGMRLTAFVADVADTMRKHQAEVIRDLSERGVDVHEAIPPPYDAVAHERRLQEILSDVDLSIHLLDTVPGRPIDGLPGWSYPRAQLKRALEEVQTSIVWCGDDAADLIVGYGDVLRHADPARVALVRGGRGDVVTRVSEAVRALLRKRSFARAARSILVDFHSKDYEHAVRMHNWLETRGMTVLAAPDADDPRRNLELFEDRLKEAGALVIAAGAVADGWVRERVNTALQVIAAADCPTKEILVHVVPPRLAPLDIDPHFGAVRVRWIDAAASKTDSDLLSRMVAEIEGAQG